MTSEEISKLSNNHLVMRYEKMLEEYSKESHHWTAKRSSDTWKEIRGFRTEVLRRLES